MPNALAPHANSLSRGNALPSGTLRAYEPSIMDRLRYVATDALTPLFGGDARRANAYYRDKLQPTAEFAPGLGESMDAASSVDAFNKGNYGTAALMAAAAGLGLVPGVGDVAAKGIKSLVKNRGDEVLSMLKQGRGAEITDEMLDLGDAADNANLNAYLYDNYDLPMDEASRAARSPDGDLYRGDQADRLSFDTGQFARDSIGVTSSSSPNVAATYMTGETPAMYPIRSNASNRLELDAEGRNWRGIPANAEANKSNLDEIIDPETYLDEENLFDFLNNQSVDWGDGTSTQMAIANTNDISRAAQNAGFDETRFNNIVDRGGAGRFHTGPANDPHTTVMTADPSNIRSKFARFDPRLKHLRNLSAGVGGGAVGINSLAQYRQQQPEQY